MGSADFKDVVIHHKLNKNNVSIIYTFPTVGDVSEFSKARVNPSILDSDYLMSRIANIDTVELKQIGKSFIYFRENNNYFL